MGTFRKLWIILLLPLLIAWTPPTKSKDVVVTTTAFDGNLSASDDNVQDALNTLDDLVAGGGGGTWGNITGTLSDQTDLDTALGDKEDTANKGQASGYASLNGSSKVVENPASASATPGANQIPISDINGKIDGYITLGASINDITEITTGIKSGGSNAVKVVTTTGTATSGDVLSFDSNGNAIASGIATSEVGIISGSFTTGNLLCANSSDEIVDCLVAPPSGPYGDVVGSGPSVSDFIPVYSGTSGDAIITSGVSVSGASKDNLNVPKVITAESVNIMGTANTKIGNVSGGKYVEFDYATGLMKSGGTGGINWSNINPITNDGINWTDVQLNDEAINWTSTFPELAGEGGSVTFSNTSPAIAAGTGAGTSPTINIEGSDSSGVIYITTGSSPATSATLATITFDSTYTHIPTTTLIPMNAATAALSGAKKPFVDWASGSTTTSVLKTGSTALDGATDYVWGYLTVGH